MKNSSMKDLYDRERGGVKMFMVRFKEGGIQMVSRVPGKTYSSGHGGKLKERLAKKLDTTKIEVEYAPSETHMFSKAYDGIDEKVAAKLQQNTKKYINKFLKGAAT